MKLYREGQKLIGSYYLSEDRDRRSICAARCDEANNVALEEFDDKGARTGVFKRALDVNDAG